MPVCCACVNVEVCTCVIVDRLILLLLPCPPISCRKTKLNIGNKNVFVASVKVAEKYLVTSFQDNRSFLCYCFSPLKVRLFRDASVVEVPI